MKDSESINLKIKKGYNLPILGASEESSETPLSLKPSTVAIYPDDFEGFIPKLDIKVGQTVKAGDSLMHHKNDPEICLATPLSGTVRDIVRGDRRHIICVIIDVDHSSEIRKFPIPNIREASAQELKKLLANSGILAFMRRRPYDIIPSLQDNPRDIFITAFDSAPLARNKEWTEADAKILETGAHVLSKITSGKVYLSHTKEQDFAFLKDYVTDVTVSGAHPAGLPGVQAANIKPVNKGECIWTLTAETLWRIGYLCLFGEANWTTSVFVDGSELSSSALVDTFIGAPIKEILATFKLKESPSNLRFISGNVLTGKKVDFENGYLRYPYSQITVIPEISIKDEFMGWASLSKNKMSINPSYPGGWFKNKFRVDARINGGRRAMIMSGMYDKFVTMDIITEYLIKAINSRDIESMEKLGIYEVAPEDFALAEVMDSSKLPLQKIVREGLDFLRKELE